MGKKRKDKVEAPAAPAAETAAGIDKPERRARTTTRR